MNPEIVKSGTFTLLDIIMTFLFTLMWFIFVEQKPNHVIETSFAFTFFMVLFAGLYYYIFDSNWNFISRYI